MSEKRYVIIITFDCVRPDHLGCYGYKGTDTKNIDELADKGMIFNNVVAQAPNTWISMASIFSGSYPNKHGVRSPYSKLSPNITTLAESLKREGFKTAGFPAHTLVGSSTGFERGFTYFNEDIEDFEFSATTKNNYYFRKWDSMWEKGKKWMLSQNSSFFVWFHYMETHWTPQDFISLPEEYKKKYSSFGQFYDGKISYADINCVRKTVDFLKAQDMYDKSLIVLHSDHGEDLVKNDPPYSYGGHNRNLFDNVMKIPLVIFNGKGGFKEKKFKKMIRSIDIMPVILELCGLPVPEGIDGKSLTDLENSKKNNDIEFAYMENLTKGWIGIRSKDWKLILTLRQNKPEKDSIKITGLRAVMSLTAEKLKEQKNNINPLIYFLINNSFRIVKFIYRSLNFFTFNRNKSIKKELPGLNLNGGVSGIEKDIVEHGIVYGLYDLKNDPCEITDVSGKNPGVVNLMKNEIVKILSRGSGTLDLIEGEDKEEIAEKLDHLGYL